MSDTFTPPDAPSPSAAGKGLTMKVGSFPLYVWFLIVAAGIGGGLLLRRLTSGFSSSAAPAPVADPYTAQSFNAGGYGSQGAVTMNGGTPGPTAEPETNNSWVKRSVIRLIALGYDAATVDSALRKYVNGEALNQAEQAIVSVAIQNSGPPPEEVPSILVFTPEAPTAPVAADPPPPTSNPVAPANQDELNRQAWMNEAQRLQDLANSGQNMSDADLDKMRGMGFTTSDPSLSATFRWYWRIWLNARGYANSNG